MMQQRDILLKILIKYYLWIEMEQYIKEMILKRAEAKKAKDFATADAIREELAAKGIVLKDTREGTTWTKA